MVKISILNSKFFFQKVLKDYYPKNKEKVMTFDSRYSLAKLEESYRQGRCSIQADNLGEVKNEREQELDRKECPWLNSYSGPMGGTNETARPEMWTAGDSFLVRKTGTYVFYDESRVYPEGVNKVEKTVGRYSSPLVQSKLKDVHKTILSEQYLMGGVDHVSDSLDLRGTRIQSLPKLKSVGANLTLDTHSDLKQLPNLKSVKGKLTVIAKNKEEMNNYLQQLGIYNDKNEPQIQIGKGVEFVMKNYI